MTTHGAAPRRRALVDTFQRLRLGPYLFVARRSRVVVYLVIGPEQFVNALTIGAIYALVALGYTMVYGIIELINFAHGDVFMVGAFVSMFVLTERPRPGRADRRPGRAGGASCSSTSPSTMLVAGPARAWPSSGSPTARCATRRAWRP